MKLILVLCVVCFSHLSQGNVPGGCPQCMPGFVMVRTLSLAEYMDGSCDLLTTPLSLSAYYYYYYYTGCGHLNWS